jgi:transposase-like protein
MNLTNLSKKFSDSEAARSYLEAQRWPDGVVCPFCGLVGEAYKLTPKPESKKSVRLGVWKCSGCRKQFTVTVGTVMEDSHIPLNTWLMAFHLLCASKKGMSAHQLHRMLGIGYKTAWFMAHRIRFAMTQDPLASQLTGIVEVDETYIGGKKRLAKRQPRKPDTGKRTPDFVSPTDNKSPVVAMVQRNGDVRSFHVGRVTAATLRPVLNHNIEYGARIMTDSGMVLHGAIHPRKHDQVNHTKQEYGRYSGGVCISTNTVEGFFSLLKRGINGIYHHVGQQHLHRYLSEFDFRYNLRKVPDGERVSVVIRRVEGKRLMYKHIAPQKAAS